MLLLVALASGGCANSQHARQQAAIASGEAQRSAEASRKHDIEDDGIEAQVPPSPAIRLAPDDPSEPFSPNYGQPANTPATTPTKPASPQPIPTGRPPRSKFAAVD